MDFTNMMNILAEEKLNVRFSPNEFTGKNSNIPYGYYDIKSPTLGSVMIEVDFVDNDGDTSDLIALKSRRFGLDKMVFDGLSHESFENAVKIVKSWQVAPSKLTEYENSLQFCYFMKPKKERVAAQKHYLHARVAYDVMSDVMRAALRNVEDDRKAYKIVAKLNDKDTEIIKIKPFVEYNKFNFPYNTVSVIIPQVGFSETFNDYATSYDIAVFNKAHHLLGDGIHSSKGRNEKDFDFSRWDLAYRKMMQKIIAARRENVKK